MKSTLPQASALQGKRVITIQTALGKSCVNDSYLPPRLTCFRHTEGMAISVLWATEPGSTLPVGFQDPVQSLKSLHPAPGASVFLLLTLPPDSVFSRADFDASAAATELAVSTPGLAERFEPDAPGFHSTETVDYITVMEGNVWLELDDLEVQLKPHDVVVQNGTRHAWRNRGETSATLSVVLIGAQRSGETKREI